MEISPDGIPWQSVYKIMIGSILPRPIGWISTMNSVGQPNLAPFSFFNAVCAKPPHVMLAPMIRASDNQEKDTLRNLRETGEFVVNIVTEALVEAMNISSTEIPKEIDEFGYAGLTAYPSVTVKPPRVAESPVHFECQVVQIFDIGVEPGAGSVVIGKVLHIHVDNLVLIGEDKISLTQLQPVGRLAGNAYCRVTDIFELARPPSQL